MKGLIIVGKAVVWEPNFALPTIINPFIIKSPLILVVIFEYNN